MSLKMMLRHEKRARLKGHRLIAGVDEAGRGPLAGPVVAGAVILRDTGFTERIDDSKRLTPAMRQRAFTEILSKAVIGVGIVSERVVDRINIYNATLLAMKEAVSNLKLKPDYVLIDGNVGPRLPMEVLTIPSGDAKSLSIACASIVAKVCRDSIMSFYDTLYPVYDFSSHKGYGTRRHMALIDAHGPSPIHRRSFSPLKSPSSHSSGKE